MLCDGKWERISDPIRPTGQLNKKGMERGQKCVTVECIRFLYEEQTMFEVRTTTATTTATMLIHRFLLLHIYIWNSNILRWFQFIWNNIARQCTHGCYCLSFGVHIFSGGKQWMQTSATSECDRAYTITPIENTHIYLARAQAQCMCVYIVGGIVWCTRN